VIDRSQGIEMNEELKARYVAEAQFLRALMYFNLVRVFGDVPLVVKEIEKAEEGYQYGRNPAAEVYAQIIADLTEAEAVLPVTYAAADAGRATRGAAKALLGKVYLTLGRHADAAGKLKEVIDLGVYDLLPSYAEVFAPGNKNHKESVFAVQYKKGQPRGGQPDAQRLCPRKFGQRRDPVRRRRPEPAPQRPAGRLRAQRPAEGLSRRPPRTKTPGAKPCCTTYVKKYSDVPAVKYDNDNNFPVIRYADVLLMYAEALNEDGYAPDGEAFTALNRVRGRVGLPAKTAADLPTQAAFRDAVLRERRVELAFEGHRWFDLVRTGRALPCSRPKPPSSAFARPSRPTTCCSPFPKARSTSTRRRIEQNRGY
jgi:hypothetical protein